MKMIYLSTPSMIGLDIQSNEIRLVKIKRKKQAFHLEWAFTCAMPDHIVKDGKIYRWDHVASLLSELIKKRVLQGVAAVAMPVNLVRIQTIMLPLGLSDVEIIGEIEAHIHQDLSGLKEALCIDFMSTARYDIGYLDVSFVAVKREVLSQYVTCINASGLKTKIVDVDIYALKRAVNWLLPAALRQEDYLVLYYSGQQAALLALHQKEIIFHQAWILTEHEDLSIQLQRSMQFYLSHYPKMHAKNLVICAQYAGLDQAVSSLRSLYAFDVFYPDLSRHFPLLNIDEIAVMSSRPFDFLVALGLAMREVPIW